MSIPIPSVNVTDLTINHLHLDQISLGKISLKNIPDIGYVYNAYILLWTLFTLIFLQTAFVAFLTIHVYRDNNRNKHINKLHHHFMES